MRYDFKYLLCLFILAASGFGARAQAPKTLITGTVVDSLSGEKVPFASVVIYSASTNAYLGGTAGNADGTFMLSSDSPNVVVEVSFVGYQKTTISKYEVVKGRVDLGTIQLVQNTQMIEGISVTAERSTLEFKLDKRVFNVGQDISSTGMGALEVLNNVPSVNVDVEGQISLRGNTGVQILINGKPSVLADGKGNALSTITADMIERIEIITNPSAKYNAAGTSGIINIVLKKQDKKGFNGSVSVNTGVPNNHSLGASLNYRTDKFNFFTQFGAGYRSRPEYNNSANTNLRNQTQVLSDGTGVRNENFYNITLGTDYYINNWNTLTLSGRYAYELETQPSETQFHLYDSTGKLVSGYDRVENTTATNPKWQYDLQYKKQFKNHKDHVLLFSTLGSFFGKDQSSEFLNSYNFGAETGVSQRTATDFHQADYTFKLDYANPLSKTWTLEAGGLYEINDVGNDYSVFNWADDAWTLDPSLTNDFRYNQKVLGVYGTAAYEGKKWGVKSGLRVENTDLKTLLATTNEANHQNYTNLFPSVHTSYKITKAASIQAGYSRRIFRPRLWDLNPFFNIQNSYNIRTGNPNLKPEYANSYEVTGIFILKKASINASVYHLRSTDVREWVSHYEDGVNIMMPINVGTNNKTGLELNGKYTATKWMSLTGDFNFGYFNRQGTYENQNFDFIGNQWSLKFTTKFKLPAKIDFEITPNYQSGYKTVQGEVSGFASVDAGLRKKLWKGKGVVNLGVRDIFASRIRETYVNQPTYNIYSFSQRGRFITLGFSYSLGKGEAMTYSGGGRR